GGVSSAAPAAARAATAVARRAGCAGRRAGETATVAVRTAGAAGGGRRGAAARDDGLSRAGFRPQVRGFAGQAARIGGPGRGAVTRRLAAPGAADTGRFSAIV